MRLEIAMCDADVDFFFKQKTAYEMRISDWSSDVCSSDLNGRAIGAGCRVGIAEELHEAAERNGADLPAGAILVVPAEQFRAETDRENLDPHTAAARHPVMSQFVDEHDDGDRKSTRLNSSHQCAHRIPSSP